MLGRRLQYRRAEPAEIPALGVWLAFRGHRCLAAELPDDRHPRGQADHCRSNDYPTRNPVTADEQDDPEDESSNERHGHERGLTCPAIECVFLTHRSSPLAGIGSMVPAPAPAGIRSKPVIAVRKTVQTAAPRSSTGTTVVGGLGPPCGALAVSVGDGIADRAGGASVWALAWCRVARGQSSSRRARCPFLRRRGTSPRRWRNCGRSHSRRP